MATSLVSQDRFMKPDETVKRFISYLMKRLNHLGRALIFRTGAPTNDDLRVLSSNPQGTP